MKKKNIILTGLGLEIYHENLGDTNEWTFAEASYQMKHLEGGGWRFPTISEMRYIDSLSDLGLINLYFDSYWCWWDIAEDLHTSKVPYYNIEEFGKNWLGSTIPDDDLNKSVRPVRDIR